jgi:hypothetical protein
MNSPSNGDRTLHPTLEDLALYAANDLPWFKQWLVRRHVLRCGECAREAGNFGSALTKLRREARAETLTGFEAIADWNRLQREMLGNIVVGVAAARCIDNVGKKRFAHWRGVLVGASLTVVFIGGWFMNIPKEQNDHLSRVIRRFMGLEVPQFNGTVVQTTPDGITVRAQGATLTLMHPASAVVTVAGSATVGARYVDEESGAVTITKVYGQ